MNIESLTKAMHSAQFARDDLQAASHGASAVEAIVIYPLIKQAADLSNGIAALLDALNAKN